MRHAAKTHEGEEDVALVAAARGGDRDAFAALLTRHHQLLVALCRRALGDLAAAEDAVQEAALQAFLGLGRLQRPERFGSWLAGIGLNVCHRALRERSHGGWSWEGLCGGAAGPEPTDPAADPAEILELAELRRRVHGAVASLPAGQRAAVVLVYLQGLTQAEAAAVLGVEVGGVTARVQKARVALRRRLMDEEEAVEKKLTRRTGAKGAGGMAGLVAVQHLTADTEARKEQARDMTDERGSERLVEMRVADVRRGRRQEGHPAHHAVILEEVGGDRRLPIWVGEFEGTAIALRLEGVAPPRPMTHAFAVGLLQAAGGRVREVQVTRLAEEVFYAVAVIEGSAGETTVDARPSDAITLALLADAPIRVAAKVLAAAGVPPDLQRERQANLYAEGTEGANGIVTRVMEEWVSSVPHRTSTKGE